MIGCEGLMTQPAVACLTFTAQCYPLITIPALALRWPGNG